MKLRFLFLLVIVSLAGNAFALEVSELGVSKNVKYRMGLTDEPEVRYSQEDNKVFAQLPICDKNVEYSLDNISPENVDICDLSKATYADLSIKKLSREVSKELEADERLMMGDLSLLWQGAATIPSALVPIAQVSALCAEFPLKR